LESEDNVDEIWKPLDACTAVADSFWACLESDATVLAEDDKHFFKSLFNPMLSDRRIDGDCFVPPDASQHYLTKLRGLVKEEELLRQRRKDRFLAKDFSVSDPGNLFPSSWACAFEVVRSELDNTSKSVQAVLHPRPDFVALDLWNHVLETSRAEFDRTAEDGLRLRIYRLANLEIRTTQEFGGEETVGAVFSTRAGWKDRQRSNNAINGYDLIVKATEYVEAGGPDRLRDHNDVKDKLGDRGLYRHYYVMLETEAGHRIVTEQLAAGHTTWQEDPDDADSRSLCAKVIRTVSCNDGVTVREIKNYQERETRTAASQSACKWYARGVCSKACGQAEIMRHQYRQANIMKRGNTDSSLLVDAPCID
jgi:hypothetical protein